MKIPSPFNFSHVVPKLHDFLSTVKHKRTLKNICSQTKLTFIVWNAKKILKISLCMFHRRKKTTQLWNDIKMSKR